MRRADDSFRQFAKVRSEATHSRGDATQHRDVEAGGCDRAHHGDVVLIAAGAGECVDAVASERGEESRGRRGGIERAVPFHTDADSAAARGAFVGGALEARCNRASEWRLGRDNRDALAPELELGQQTDETAQIVTCGSEYPDDHLVTAVVQFVTGAAVIDEEAAGLFGDAGRDAGEATGVRPEDYVGASIRAERAIDFGASHGIARVVVALERELTSLAGDAERAAGVGVRDEQSNRNFGLPAHRRVFAGEGEREADGDFHGVRVRLRRYRP